MPTFACSSSATVKRTGPTIQCQCLRTMYGSAKSSLADYQSPAQPDVPGRAADHHAERAGLDDPVHALVQQLKLIRTQREVHFALLARRELDSPHPPQLHDRPRDARQLVVKVELHDLRSRARTRVPYETTHAGGPVRADLGGLGPQCPGPGRP